MTNWIDAKKALPIKRDGLRASVKVINQDGDSVYWSIGYQRWMWWLSINYEEEVAYPTVTHWAEIKPPTERAEG